jgi:hypothetical protein
VRICVLIKSEGSAIAIEYTYKREKRDTFCDTHKQADGRGTKQKKRAAKKIAKAKERDARGRKLIHPKKTHANTFEKYI